MFQAAASTSSSLPPPFLGENIEVMHHASARKRRGVRPVSMQPNLTSMIDVIFQLLIYFVVTSNFAMGEGVIIAKLPEGTGQVAPSLAPPSQKLKVHVYSRAADPAGYVIRIDGQPESPASFKRLAQLLASMQANERNPGGIFKPSDPVVIYPDAQVRWQHAMNAFNAAITARYSDVRFAQSSP